MGDFNRDGAPDVATANGSSGTVSVLIGDGQGGFGGPTSYPVGGNASAIATGDFNRDGLLELVVSDAQHAHLGVLPGLLGGTFGAAQTVPTPGPPNRVAVGDVNGDGFEDLVSSDFGPDPRDLSVELGDGSGGFGAPVAQTTGGLDAALALADLNGDLRADLITADGGAKSASVLAGNPDGTFGPVRSFQLSNAGRSLAIADFNGDAHADVAIGLENHAFTVLLGDGAGDFPSQADFATKSTSVNSVAAADFDRDGRVDLAAAATGFETLRGTGLGTFESATTHPAGGFFAFKVGDLNGDGAPDIVGVSGTAVVVRTNTSTPGPDPLPQAAATDPPVEEPIEGIWQNTNSLFEVYATGTQMFAERGLGSGCTSQPLGLRLTGSGRRYTGAARAYRPGDCAFVGDAPVEITLSSNLDVLTYSQGSPPGSSCCSRNLTFQRVKPTAVKTADVRLISGSVALKCPGKAQRSLASGAVIKLGCKVDATNGVVAIDSATGTGKVEHSGNFSEGAFVVSQTANPSKFKPVAAAKAKRKPLLTVLSLVGPKPTGCKAKVAVHAARRGKRLRGHTRHAVRTVAQHAAATVHGTIWLMEDRCDGTFVKVSRGVVTVRDFKRKKDVKVTAGHSYLAKAR